MPSLKELLDELQIDTSDLDKKEDEINLKDVKLDDIPEAQRPIFEKMIATMDEQTNAIASRDIAMNTMKEALVLAQQKEPEKKEEKKEVFGLAEDDPYAPAFSKLSEMIGEIKSANTVDTQKEFETNLVNFAQKNKDIVRYVQDMDKLIEEHPTLKGDVPKLYTLAKSISERRTGLEKDKKDDLERQRELNAHRSESPGMSGEHASGIVQSGTIAEAFDAAEKSVNK